jgi:hypothetical protein
MSAITNSNTPRFDELEIASDQIKAAVKSAGAKVTLELIRDIAGNKGVLTDELRSRLEEHPLYQMLVESDRKTLAKAEDAGVKYLLQDLLIDAFNALDKHTKLYSTTSWTGLVKFTKIALSKMEPVGTEPSDGQRAKPRRRGGKKDPRAARKH